MRIHEFSKKFNMNNKKIIEKMNELGYETKSHMSDIKEEAYTLLLEALDLDASQEDPYWESEYEKDHNKSKKKKANQKKSKNKNAEERISNIPVTEEIEKENVIYFKEDLTVGQLAEQIEKPASDVIKTLMQLGIMASINHSLDRDTVELIGEEAGFEVKDEVVTDATKFEDFVIEDSDEDLQERPPVVTIMGHVDHGKTTLLDAIRHSRVVNSEAGGITQHIGAYQVEKDGKKITFIDTPGHAAFTEMRARGAKVTDLVIIVVAADDGVMPQTREAIDHAKAAECPIIVAINKMDKPTANPDRVMQELTEYNLIPEEWGGNTVFVKVSALKGEGIDECLDMINLAAEMEELKANPKRLASGTVVEAKLDKGRGTVATILVQNGTLRIGDAIVIGKTYGRVRAMANDINQEVKEAGPSTPVEIIGIHEVPLAGDPFMVFSDDKEARKIAEARESNVKREEQKTTKAVSLDDLFAQIQEGEIKELNLIVKADVQGSVEALKGALHKIDVEGVKVNIIRSGAGAIAETDVSLAAASNAIIIGFNVRPTGKTRELAREEGVEIRLHTIIYKVTEEIESAMKGMLDPEFEEKVIGQAEVRDTFKVSRVGTIAGCMVIDGKIQRNSKVRVIREGVIVYEGELSTLKRFKDDAKEVAQGYECGLTVENYNDLKVGDIIEVYIMEEIEAK
ncbi:translation initiation factor IF-2 [Haloplasma contractile]|uniref:Translation initiation factor IF-2 n=1 Tax=Haloplasma contractile SSD-17B TaxID=1033810 RepID=U2FRE1_9MOLU|nr:translation initiation factor IF-2 [Haloplasma contractile]ERJ13524.1 Translation initiation factor IF-2 protein [Haloplasma contractile SSD-17B]